MRKSQVFVLSCCEGWKWLDPFTLSFIFHLSSALETMPTLWIVKFLNDSSFFFYTISRIRQLNFALNNFQFLIMEWNCLFETCCRSRITFAVFSTLRRQQPRGKIFSLCFSIFFAVALEEKHFKWQGATSQWICRNFLNFNLMWYQSWKIGNLERVVNSNFLKFSFEKWNYGDKILRKLTWKLHRKYFQFDINSNLLLKVSKILILSQFPQVVGDNQVFKFICQFSYSAKTQNSKQ